MFQVITLHFSNAKKYKIFISFLTQITWFGAGGKFFAFICAFLYLIIRKRCNKILNRLKDSIATLFACFCFLGDSTASYCFNYD